MYKIAQNRKSHIPFAIGAALIVSLSACDSGSSSSSSDTTPEGPSAGQAADGFIVKKDQNIKILTGQGEATENDAVIIAPISVDEFGGSEDFRLVSSEGDGEMGLGGVMATQAGDFYFTTLFDGDETRTAKTSIDGLDATAFGDAGSGTIAYNVDYIILENRQVEADGIVGNAINTYEGDDGEFRANFDTGRFGGNIGPEDNRLVNVNGRIDGNTLTNGKATWVGGNYPRGSESRVDGVVGVDGVAATFEGEGTYGGRVFSGALSGTPE